MRSFDVEKVSASYGRQRILYDVSFNNISSGTFVGLLGPNASGKSTLMKRLSGELTGKGDVLLDGKSVMEISKRDWVERVVSMPQMPIAPTALTPTELMWSTARALGFDYSDIELSQKIEMLFDEFGLSEFALSALSTLSGGKRQLVALALAIIRDPEVLLLDEPTSALDLYWRMVVLDFVRARVKKTNGVVIAALHDLDLAVRYCDKIVLLEKGRLVSFGTPDQVLSPDNLSRVYHVETEISKNEAGRMIVEVLRPLTGNLERE